MRRGTRLHLPLSECKDCQDPIRWVRLNTGKSIAVNPGESPTGTVAAAIVGTELQGWVASQKKPARPRMRRFTPHVATCTAIDRPEKPEPPPVLFDVHPHSSGTTQVPAERRNRA